MILFFTNFCSSPRAVIAFFWLEIVINATNPIYRMLSSNKSFRPTHPPDLLVNSWPKSLAAVVSTLKCSQQPAKKILEGTIILLSGFRALPGVLWRSYLTHKRQPNHSLWVPRKSRHYHGSWFLPLVAPRLQVVYLRKACIKVQIIITHLKKRGKFI